MKDFIRFSVSLLLTAVLVAFFDLTGGTIMNFVSSKYGNLDFYRAKNNNSEVAIIGASVSFNQYDCRVMSDSLNCRVYNYGAGGQNVFYHYSLLHYLLELSENKPQLILYNPCYIDLADAKGWNTEKLDALYFDYSTDSVIQEVLKLQDKKKQVYLSISQLYKHNSQIPNYIKNMSRINHPSDGYMPLYGEWNNQKEDNENTNLSLDTLKVKYAILMFDLCKKYGVPLYVTIAPVYLNYRIEEPWLVKIKEIAIERGFPILDYTNDSLFMQHPEWYYNPMHLNAKGASVFTSIVSHDLKKRITYFNRDKRDK